MADNLRIDINVHGGRNEQKQHRIFGVKAEDFLEDLKDILVQHSGKQELAAEWHLWSCYGGSSNKAAHILGKNNTLITHIDSKNMAFTDLEYYIINRSVENYLANPQKDIYTRWIEEQKYSFQPSAFNFNPTSDKEDTIHLKSARTLKPEILKDIVKKVKSTNDLTTVFTDFIAEDIRKIENSREFKKTKELGYFKSNFKESDEVKIEVSDEEAKNLALGIAIYLSGLTKEQNLDTFKEYISVIQKNGVDIGDTKSFNLSPLSIAARAGHDEVVKTLLSHGADVNMSDKTGVTPLFFAAKEGHDEVVKTLLKHGADVNMPNKHGVTSLFFAAQNGYDEVVKTLLKHGADVDMSNKYGVTALFFAAQNGHDEVVKTLLKHGADVNMPNKAGVTPLFFAAKDGHDEVVKTLLKHGADVNMPNKAGVTPLFFAAQNEHDEVVKTLLKHGANADLKSIAYLKKENIDIDMSAKDGSTLLLRAIKNDQTDIVEALLEADADLNKANSKDGTTPLQAAMSTKNKDIIKLITKSALKDQSVTNTPTFMPSTLSKNNSKTRER